MVNGCDPRVKYKKREVPYQFGTSLFYITILLRAIFSFFTP